VEWSKQPISQTCGNDDVGMTGERVDDEVFVRRVSVQARFPKDRLGVQQREVLAHVRLQVLLQVTSLSLECTVTHARHGRSERLSRMIRDADEQRHVRWVRRCATTSPCCTTHRDAAFTLPPKWSASLNSFGYSSPGKP
jgi:hypothetical protein